MGAMAKRLAEKARRQRVMTKEFDAYLDPTVKTQTELSRTAEEIFFAGLQTFACMGYTAEETDALVVEVMIAMADRIGEALTLAAFENTKRKIVAMAEEAQLDLHMPVRATKQTGVAL